MSRINAGVDLLPKADERMLAEHTAMLLAAIIHADGTVDGDEVALARLACEEFAIPLELLDNALAVRGHVGIFGQEGLTKAAIP